MIKEKLLLFVEIEDRAVTVFMDQNQGTGVDEKKHTGDPSLSETRVLYFQKRMFIYLHTSQL